MWYQIFQNKQRKILISETIYCPKQGSIGRFQYTFIFDNFVILFFVDILIVNCSVSYSKNVSSERKGWVNDFFINDKRVTELIEHFLKPRFCSSYRGIVNLWKAEAVAYKCSVKKVPLKILQSSQKKIYSGISLNLRLKAGSWNLLFNKALGCFPMNLAKFLRAPIL